MIYDVEINGRVRRVGIERRGEQFAVAIDGRRQTADVTVVNGVWSLILWDVEELAQSSVGERIADEAVELGPRR